MKKMTEVFDMFASVPGMESAKAAIAKHDGEQDMAKKANKPKLSKKEQAEVKELETIIEALDTAFHETGDDCINPITGEVVLDNEYDALKKRLFDLCPSSPIFSSVHSGKSKIRGKKVKHDPPMTSINKCNGTEAEKQKILCKWFEDCRKVDMDISRQKHYPAWLKAFFVMSFKHDGIALSLVYKDGQLVEAGLRSKSGKDGIDVTDKMKYVKGVPTSLKEKVDCIVRGELETPISEFKRVSDELGDNAKANPRAHTAGSLNLKDAEDLKGRGICFIAYNVIMDDAPFTTEVERGKWAKKQGFGYVQFFPFEEKELQLMEDGHRKLDFMVDGVVISVNELDLQAQLGHSGNKDTGNPKGKIAWKFKDEVKEVKVKEIIWQTGRTGNVTPVLIFDGVQLEGTTVCRCTAHNVGIIKSNKIGVGSRIEIIKSGKIIPKLKSVVQAYGKVKVPDVCPCCGDNLIEEEGSNDALALVCDNADCPAQNIKSLNHFLTILGVKGISESTITKLMDAGFLSKRSDFYKLNIRDLVENGFTQRTATLIDARIWMVPAPEQIKDDTKLRQATAAMRANGKKLPIPLDRFFASFGIDGSGKEVGRLLADKYGDIEKIRYLTQSELCDIDGIGPITATNTVAFFHSNQKELDELLKFIEPVYVKKAVGKLTGKNVVLSGSLDGGKAKWKDLVEANGGTVKGSVGKKTDYLVAGEGSGSKSDKAKELGITIMTTDEFSAFLDS